MLEPQEVSKRHLICGDPRIVRAVMNWFTLLVGSLASGASLGLSFRSVVLDQLRSGVWNFGQTPLHWYCDITCD